MAEIPTVITPNKEFKELQKKLDEVEDRVERTNAEIFQRTGQKTGRDVGIVLGFAVGTVLLYSLAGALQFFNLIK
ncbi:tetrahydromethanopterin S-methyltransferase subunit G [Methanococcus voltae]|jgi:tetrahydromethanopterin S-methyltransferase subunit G|uniref:Tetrahydromethanopterin S-methyltransferase subunit G n=2 Tax=Methanococcus voltae TaxID=2188 RepID=A0A8J7RCR0_METVO|nr:tetrahydromethanopterin S-methyltransferase subunit G [Methanococcus voltae]MBP2143095.1 tetrahydromethanopterin S-methyltransferase subunit G [Methanococcus voltae]MBP2172206.1 tetrahydromethanopterin S-methyltransferase subunit G [Methanococcus voltae]MBP2200837.1 tetrahydromethanopterin S-methyltransferase subunit G [Methanococcus voltae]MCS3921561.1 tetrahydromethanopterin S-methyltransferase subunit G [Methanococcus voltae PS]